VLYGADALKEQQLYKLEKVAKAAVKVAEKAAKAADALKEQQLYKLAKVAKAAVEVAEKAAKAAAQAAKKAAKAAGERPPPAPARKRSKAAKNAVRERSKVYRDENKEAIYRKSREPAAIEAAKKTRNTPEKIEKKKRREFERYQDQLEAAHTKSKRKGEFVRKVYETKEPRKRGRPKKKQLKEASQQIKKQRKEVPAKTTTSQHQQQREKEAAPRPLQQIDFACLSLITTLCRRRGGNDPPAVTTVTSDEEKKKGCQRLPWRGQCGRAAAGCAPPVLC
jgi:hypothetical protein